MSSLYRCDKCNLEFNEFKYRFMVSMEIEDHSGSTWITSFKESESILGKFLMIVYVIPMSRVR